MGKSNPSPPPPPNYMPIANAQAVASQQQYNIAQAQLNFARNQFTVQNARADRQQAMLEDYIQDARERQEMLDEQAAQDRQYYERTFRPLERSLVRESEQYTPQLIEQRARADAGRAAADVSQQYEVARAAAQDRLEGYGIDPSQVRSQALDIGARTQLAAARAGAYNQTHSATEDRERAYGTALRAGAIDIGRGLAGSALTTSQAALAQSQGAAGFGQQGFQNYGSNVAQYGQMAGTAPQWSQLGGSSLAGAGSTMATGYQGEVSAYRAAYPQGQQSTGWGSALGAIAGMGATALMPGLQAGMAPMVAGWFAAEGGQIEEPAPPGPMQAIPTGVPHQGVPIGPESSPSQGKVTDDVPARLNVGEFVIPTDAVRWHGEKTFHQLIEKSRKDRQGVTAKPKMQALPVEAPAVSTAPMPHMMPPTAAPVALPLR